MRAVFKQVLRPAIHYAEAFFIERELLRRRAQGRKIRVKHDESKHLSASTE